MYQDRYVPIPADLTEPVEIVQPYETITTLDLRQMFVSQRTQARMCNAQLQAISELGAKE